MIFDDLAVGDLFRFDYPHHSEARFRPVWRRLGDGYQRVDSEEWHPDPSPGIPLRVELVSDQEPQSQDR